MPHFSDLLELDTLDIAGTDISDASVEHLSKLTHLKRLDAVDTLITEVGMKRLAAALAGCDVSWGPRIAVEKSAETARHRDATEKRQKT